MQLNEHGRRHHDPARLRAGPAAEADLQLRSGHRRELQAGAAGGRPGRSRRQRQEGDRLQPVGQVPRDPRRTSCAASARCEYHGQIPSKQRDGVLKQFKEDKSKHVILMSYGAGSVGPQPAVLRVRVPLRPLVEPGRRGPGDQPRPPHRRRRAGHRHAHARPWPRSKSGSTRSWSTSASCSTRSSARPPPPPRLGLSQAEIFGLFNLRTPKGRDQAGGVGLSAK